MKNRIKTEFKKVLKDQGIYIYINIKLNLYIMNGRDWMKLMWFIFYFIFLQFSPVYKIVYKNMYKCL